MEELANTARWYTYILRTADNVLYTGVATNPTRRLKEHEAGPKHKGAKALAGRQRPFQIVYLQEWDGNSPAQSWEVQVKDFTRKNKDIIIRTNERVTADLLKECPWDR